LQFVHPEPDEYEPESHHEYPVEPKSLTKPPAGAL
jgi:hypothetical protein